MCSRQVLIYISHYFMQQNKICKNVQRPAGLKFINPTNLQICPNQNIIPTYQISTTIICFNNKMRNIRYAYILQG